MQRFSRKLSAVLLTLLLGLSPLQGVMAGFVSSFDKGDGVQQMAHMHGGPATDAGRVAADCEQCGHGDGCAGSDCSSGQCAFCALAILPDFFYLTNSTDKPRFSPMESDLARGLTFSLFRPPRV